MPTTVLLTGATGFLGGALAAQLLATRPDLHLIVLARAAAGLGPRERVLRSLRRFGDPSGAFAAGRIAIAAGDLRDRRVLAEIPFARVTRIVHLAVDGGSSAEARAANVDSTLALAQSALLGGRLERFLYVSSAWICGAGARGVVREDDAPHPEPVRDYLVDKVLTERLLARVPGLPLMIARPSLVMGHTALGCEPSASLFWILRLVDHLGRLPWAKRRRLDVVPVDWVAAALEHLLFAPAPAHACCHLSAGPTGAVSWGDIESAFARADGRPRRYDEEPRSVAAWASSVVANDPSASSLSEGTLLACLRFLEGDAVFDDVRARALGIPAAPRLTEHLGVCLRRAADRTIAEQSLDDGG